MKVEARIPPAGFLRGLNTHLPPAIAVRELADVPDGFDARRSARGKVYRYLIWNHLVRSPRRARWSWHLRAPLDTHALREAAAAFVGQHDFKAFRAADCERRSTVRLIRSFTVVRDGALVTCEVEGTAFLKNMVRIMVGTLVAAGDRTSAGVTAPAHGLTLVRVIY